MYLTQIGAERLICGFPQLGTRSAVDLVSASGRKIPMARDDDNIYRELSWPCPFCGVTVELKAVKVVFGDGADYLVCRCPRDRKCGALLFVKYDRIGRDAIEEVYPFPNASPETFNDAIPKKLRDDYAEAVRCFYAKAYKGVVVMARRLLQNLARDKGIKRGENIKTEIAELFAKGLITKSLHDAAHEMRHFGGFGAHPQDDDLDNVTHQDVDAMFTIMRQFTEHVYVLPSQTAELAKKRQQLQQSKKQTP
jgi:hypothetical protein